MNDRRAAAEFVGTMVLVIGGVGSAVIAGEAIGAIGVAFAFGFTLLALAYAIGPISGCHVNPAVTLGLLYAGKVDRDEAVRYWIAQVAGAIAGAAILVVIVKAKEGGYDLQDGGLGANGYGDHSPAQFNLLAALIVEVVMTALLVFVVLSATDKIANTAFAGIPIGLTLCVIHLVGIPVDNLSVNPARSIGPAVFVLDWAIGQLWLFIVAPLVGGVLGALIHRFLFEGSRPIPARESAVAAETP